ARLPADAGVDDLDGTGDGVRYRSAIVRSAERVREHGQLARSGASMVGPSDWLADLSRPVAGGGVRRVHVGTDTRKGAGTSQLRSLLAAAACRDSGEA